MGDNVRYILKDTALTLFAGAEAVSASAGALRVSFYVALNFVHHVMLGVIM